MKQDAFELGAVYHIYNRGNNKENIFIEEKNYNYFLQLIKKHLLPFVDLYCYCFLKNHFHLLLRINDSIELPEKYQTKPYLPFSNLFNAYTKSINKAYNRTGSLFQEHLQRNRVTDENYLLQLVAYIHLNPVKHKFVKNFKKYPYSSYDDYCSEKESMVNKKYILNLFENIENFEYWHDLNKIKSDGIIDVIEKNDI
jgi:REP element-mobilizing transposase RayT